MSKIFLVAEREFLENVRTKSFWLGILLFPLLIGLAIGGPILLQRFKSARSYAVMDRSGWLANAMEREILAADLAHVLRAAAEKHDQGDAALAELPDVLQPLAAVAARLEEAQLRLLARSLADAGRPAPSGSEAALSPPAPPSSGLPPDALAATREHGRAVVDWWSAASVAEARQLAPGASRTRFVRVDVDAPPGQLEEELNSRLRDGELFAYFVIGPDPVAGNAGSKYVSKNLTDTGLMEWFGTVASAQVRLRRLEQEGIDPKVAGWIQQPLAFESRKLTAAGEEAGVETHDLLKQWAPVAFVYLLWLSVFMAAQMLLTNTIEEKSNRIMEVLLSAVSPIQLMAGKIAGIAATGLTMVASWVVTFFLAALYLPRLLDAPPKLEFTALLNEPVYIGSFLAYFLLGYVLFAAILVAIGSMCNTLKEAQNLMTPITLVLVLPLLAMMPIGQDPNGTLARVLSYIPPFTPFVMMNRAAGPPTAFEYLTTTMLLVASIFLALWAAAKIFRIGILLTGKPPRLREILRWIRAPVGQVVVPQEERVAVPR